MGKPNAAAALGCPPSSSVSLLLILSILLCYARLQQSSALVAARRSSSPEIGLICLPRSGHIGVRPAPARTWLDHCWDWIWPGRDDRPWRSSVREPKPPEFPDLASWPCTYRRFSSRQTNHFASRLLKSRGSGDPAPNQRNRGLARRNFSDLASLIWPDFRALNRYPRGYRPAPDPFSAKLSRWLEFLRSRWSDLINFGGARRYGVKGDLALLFLERTHCSPESFLVPEHRMNGSFGPCLLMMFLGKVIWRYLDEDLEIAAINNGKRRRGAGKTKTTEDAENGVLGGA